MPGAFSLFGLTIPYAALFSGAMMITIGALAGFFVVPMNALLQHRGHVLMSAGRSIAVQNFNENSSILLMLGIYSLLIRCDVSVETTMLAFGLAVALCMCLVIAKHHHNQSKGDSLHLIGEAEREGR